VQGVVGKVPPVVSFPSEEGSRTGIKRPIKTKHIEIFIFI
jgi:hypothetical protein